jgi:transmembrane sensor
MPGVIMTTETDSKKQISELIIKVISGQASPGECIILDEWVRKSDNNRQFFLRMRNGWLASSQASKHDRAKTLKALDIINQKINSGQTVFKGEDGIKHLPGRNKSLPGNLKIAALWILLFGLGALFSMIINKPVRLLNQNLSVTVIAPRGSKALTILPDRTVVWLNAGSKIEYRMADNSPVREVALEGEAYFDVAKDAAHRFSVNAGEMVIKAFGTKFNVKAYPEEREVETTLVEGSVSVEIRDRPSNKTMLKPDEQAIFYKQTADRTENFLVTKGIDPSRYTLWIKDKLQIKGETLEDLAVILERKYDVKIRFDDSTLRNLRFTGVIENETIEQIMDLIKISSNVDYRFEGRIVWLSKSRK